MKNIEKKGGVSFEVYFKLSQKFRAELNNYVLDKGHIGDDYYISKVILGKMSELAYRDGEYLKIVYKWLDGGSTLELKKALEFVDYDDNNISNFNAMSLMDTVSCVGC